jgi:hypothetical protein
VWLACLLTALAFYGRARLDVPILQKHEKPVLAAQTQPAN